MLILTVLPNAKRHSPCSCIFLIGQQRMEGILQHTAVSQTPISGLTMPLSHWRPILEQTTPISPSVARRPSWRPKWRWTTSWVERRHAGRKPTRRRERKVAGSSPWRRERQPTRRWEGQAACAARRGDGHRRQVGRATGAAATRRGKGREGLIRAGAYGRREGKVAWRRRGAWGRGCGCCCCGGTWW